MNYNFHVGQIITCIKGCHEYSVTNERGEYKILSIDKRDSYDRLNIEVVKHLEDLFVGNTYWVRSKYFKPVNTTQQDEMERLGYGV